MATAGDVFHNPTTGERVTVLLGADDTDGRYLAASMAVPPGDCRLGEHLHPGLVEAFEVRRGRLTFSLDGEERIARPGERIVVPRGARHDYWNDGPQDAEILLEVWPAKRFEQLVGTLMGLAREGLVDEHGSPDPLQAAVTAREFRRELVLCSPPRWLQRVVNPVLAAIGRLCGMKGSYARHAVPVDRVTVEHWDERPEPAAGEQAVAAVLGPVPVVSAGGGPAVV
ncbi:cupin domain-containing protein [Conexibacter sp. SYSU D00693]|uniref:cupin domain-containing protein n=1 Tax=Conexibacter sp. SYSU D00693 TaxID=2812560 RepID=UPI00196B5B57|nr:cupin domain-containing protein [Conexibacter sp. SYSU D00693]